MIGDLPDSAPAPAAADKAEAKSVPVSVMLHERKAKQAAEEERDRAMETTRKQSDRIKSQQTQIEELNGTILSLEARVEELETQLPPRLGLRPMASLADYDRLVNRKLP
jgi:TolA-binding protein